MKPMERPRPDLLHLSEAGRIVIGDPGDPERAVAAAAKRGAWAKALSAELERIAGAAPKSTPKADADADADAVTDSDVPAVLRAT